MALVILWILRYDRGAPGGLGDSLGASGGLGDTMVFLVVLVIPWCFWW